MCLRRAPEKYIAGAALDRADLVHTNGLKRTGMCTGKTQEKRRNNYNGICSPVYGFGNFMIVL
jgi:hypothetical protein